MASFLYTLGVKSLLLGDIALDTDNLRLVLATYGYSPDQDAHDYQSDLGANEVSGTGYTASGQTLASATVTTSTGLVKFDADDVSWTSASISAYYGVICKYVGATTSNPLIALIDFAGTQTSTSGTFTVAWSSGGIFTISV